MSEETGYQLGLNRHKQVQANRHDLDRNKAETPGQIGSRRDQAWEADEAACKKLWEWTGWEQKGCGAQSRKYGLGRARQRIEALNKKPWGQDGIGTQVRHSAEKRIARNSDNYIKMGLWEQDRIGTWIRTIQRLCGAMCMIYRYTARFGVGMQTRTTRYGVQKRLWVRMPTCGGNVGAICNIKSSTRQQDHMGTKGGRDKDNTGGCAEDYGRVWD